METTKAPPALLPSRISQWIGRQLIRTINGIARFFLANWRSEQREAAEWREQRSPAMRAFEERIAARVKQETAASFVREYEQRRRLASVRPVAPSQIFDGSHLANGVRLDHMRWTLAHTEEYEQARSMLKQPLPPHPNERPRIYDENPRVLLRYVFEGFFHPKADHGLLWTMIGGGIPFASLCMLATIEMPLNHIERIVALVNVGEIPQALAKLFSPAGQWLSVPLWIAFLSLWWISAIFYEAMGGWKCASYEALRPFARLSTYIFRSIRFERWVHERAPDFGATVVKHLHLQIIAFFGYATFLIWVLIGKALWHLLPDLHTVLSAAASDAFEAHPFLWCLPALLLGLGGYAALRVVISRWRKAHAGHMVVRSDFGLSQRALLFIGGVFGRKLAALTFLLLSITSFVLLCLLAAGIVYVTHSMMVIAGYGVGLVAKLLAVMMVSGLVIAVLILLFTYAFPLLCMVVGGAAAVFAPPLWRMGRLVVGSITPQGLWE